MMIEKGLTAEQMSELFKSKRNPYTWLKLGIIYSWCWFRNWNGSNG